MSLRRELAARAKALAEETERLRRENAVLLARLEVLEDELAHVRRELEASRSTLPVC